MARPKEFDREIALDAAISVFREQGFEGTSTGDLTGAMQIGRQSLYDTFGDKWQIYQAALKRYADLEGAAHAAALSTGPRAIHGLEIMLARVRASAAQGCLGLGATCEFGRRAPELTALSDAAGRRLQSVLVARLKEAQDEGDVGADVDVREAAGFIVANIAGIRLAARGGAGAEQLQALAELTLRALR